MPRAPSRQQEIERALVGLHTSIPQQQRDESRDHNRTIGLDAAADYALDLCASHATQTR